MDTQTNTSLKQVPFNFGPIKGFSAHSRLTGPCGDTMEFWLTIEEKKIVRAHYTTDGCYHIACMLTLNRTVDDFEEALNPQGILEKIGDAIPESSKHCALLAKNAIKLAIKDYKCQNCNSESSCSVKDKPSSCSLSKEKNDSTFKEIGKKILIQSGKGGVGKSTVATNLAISLSKQGFKVGLLDIDIHGPSIPTMLQLDARPVMTEENMIEPLEFGGLKVMSIGFLLNDKDDAVIWRGPMKNSIIKQFLENVNWGKLDYMVIDAPPGTGDELLSLHQLLGNVDGSIIVTTPQEVAASDVRKSIKCSLTMGIPILGIVENMSGFTCPKCHEITHIFQTGSGEKMAEKYKLPFFGKIPLEKSIGESCDNGNPFIQGITSESTRSVFSGMVDIIKKGEQN